MGDMLHMLNKVFIMASSRRKLRARYAYAPVDSPLIRLGVCVANLKFHLLRAAVGPKRAPDCCSSSHRETFHPRTETEIAFRLIMLLCRL